MGIVGVEPFLVRLADTEEECMQRELNNAALGAFTAKELKNGRFWIERWSEERCNWVEV